jgi:hypothetical protein
MMSVIAPMMSVIHDYKGRKIRVGPHDGGNQALVQLLGTGKWVSVSRGPGPGAGKAVLAAAKDFIDQGKV